MTTAESTAQQGIMLTEEAVRQAKRWVAREKNPDAFVRMGLMGGGCSGFSYVLKLDTDLSPTDNVFEFEGVRVVVDRRSMRYLAGTVLEYTGDLMMPGGFEFRNPNATRGCGCGLSFSV
jgi:iron-sulfur cluster assembly protein